MTAEYIFTERIKTSIPPMEQRSVSEDYTILGDIRQSHSLGEHATVAEG